MTYVGQGVLGLTNRQLAAGKGTFVADIALPHMAHLAVVRSPHAHARIRSIDTKAAEAVPGVVCVVTGAEIVANTDPIPPAYDTTAMFAKQIETYALAIKKARYVGEPVAAVVAEDRYTAVKAAALVDVDYEVLPAVTDVDEALKPGSTLVEESWGDNVLISRDHVMGEPDARLREADGIVKGVLQTHRYTGAAIEPRAYLATHDPYTNMTTMWACTQSPHPMRCFLAKTLRMRETDLRIIQPHVGGAFGLKLPTFQEEPLIGYLARKLVRPVRWIEERTESLAVGGHAREERIRFEAGYKKDGQVTVVSVHILADIGAPSALCGWGMSNVTAFCLPTVYEVPDCHVRLHSVVTNKCPWNAYRGYGKEAATFVMERIMDLVADELGMDVSIEMHRDTGTETPEKTFAIADGYEKATRKKLKMNFDFSHFALTKGLRPPFFERLTVRPDLIWVANQLHLRPFNGHHCQIPVIDHRGAHTPEFTDWLEFVDGLIGLWLQKAAPGATLWTCPELIGGAYGLSTFPKNWVQAKVVREELDKIWNRRIRAWKAPAPARA